MGSLDVREWAVGAIQDQFKLDATSAEPFEMPDYETASFVAGWGGLPDREARFVSIEPGNASDEYKLVVRDAPVDGF